ncbi:DNA-binding PadR family transcriptional regulator [Methanolinea mesophila]|uniref:PadR family transcriptional regulator n=1 Tax=Methanolinea mesophila TaxID=547055 RepID=UPI001AE45FD1|nr:PadR family transcriptional regulator [Methanolinea mesophila]MBP1929806.1 DNA-binding PadR family transcriptional regulator [Methanolinea mesophila]
MTGIWKFAGKGGKERGLLALYILHALDTRPGTGYDLLKEIEEKTGGQWVPSKGTLYPVLKQLEEERLIELSETGSRAKNIYVLTPKGRKTLAHIKEHRRGPGEKLVVYQTLLAEIFGQEKIVLMSLGMEIHALIHDLPPEKEHDAITVMEECISRLKNI